jgi:hypothetical protein
LANTSTNGLKSSAGLMVNYLYDFRVLTENKIEFKKNPDKILYDKFNIEDILSFYK